MKRSVSLFLLIALIFSMAAISGVATNTDTMEGMTFNESDVNTTTSPWGAMINTYEAWLKLPTTLAASVRGGVIFGNYGADGPVMSIEIYSNYNPRLYIKTTTTQSYVFTNTVVPLGEWFHLAITRNVTAGTTTCYINGVAKQTLSLTGEQNMTITSPMVLGGDLRSGNTAFFKGEIHELALWSSVRTTNEINTDMTHINDSDTALIGHYLYSGSVASMKIDRSTNANNIIGSSDLVYSDDGYRPSIDDYYLSESVISTVPNTYESWINLPIGMSAHDRGGVIYGNFGGDPPYCSIEIYTEFHPRLYLRSDANSSAKSYIFDQVTIPVGEWVHLVIVRNVAAGTTSCYINGELRQTLTLSGEQNFTCATQMGIGCDLRASNEQYFKGNILSINLYDDVRTAQEIASDYTNGAPVNDANIIAAWSFKDFSYPDVLEDMSANKYNIIRHVAWFDSYDPGEYEYTFAVIGDTQVVTERHPDKLATLYQWIVSNVSKMNIRFVMGLGDITNSNTLREWETAKNAISLMDGIVPYSLVVGNHEYDAVGTAIHFNQTFPLADFSSRSYFGGSYDDTIINAWYQFDVGDINYIVFALEFGPRDEFLEWAANIISEHPQSNIIITTHCYLNTEGNPQNSNDASPPRRTKYPTANNGDVVWEKLVSKHKNIVLVISGHYPSDNVIISSNIGDHGNVVQQILCDPQGVDAAQGATGLVLLLHFSKDGTKVSTEYYSPIKEKYFLKSNQSAFDLNVITASGDSSETSDNSIVTTSTQTNDTIILVFSLAIMVLVASVSFFILFAVVKNKGGFYFKKTASGKKQ